MSNSIHISELSKEISNVVKSYSKEVELEAGEATELVAKETVQELKRSSPKRSGKYARNWTKRKQGPTGQHLRRRSNPLKCFTRNILVFTIKI